MKLTHDWTRADRMEAQGRVGPYGWAIFRSLFPCRLDGSTADRYPWPDPEDPNLP